MLHCLILRDVCPFALLMSVVSQLVLSDTVVSSKWSVQMSVVAFQQRVLC